MTGAILVSRSAGAAFLSDLGRVIMDVILHLGAHRTGTTTFQHYVRDHADALRCDGVSFWGPMRSRKVVFPGLFRTTAVRSCRNVARRAEGRVQMMCQQAEDRGVTQLLVSDENLIGTCAHNLQTGSLYPAIGDRMARVAEAFGDRIVRVLLATRAQDLWWASACALTVSRGHGVPSYRRLDNITAKRRGWRDVITDLACAVPGADIRVLPFEHFVGRPDAVLRIALVRPVPPDSHARWLNRSADVAGLRRFLVGQGATPDLIPDIVGRWQPFDTQQCATLREFYADDLHWLTAGADGLGTLTEDETRKRADKSLPPGMITEGHDNEYGQGNMA